jgi:hypothetical protein
MHKRRVTGAAGSVIEVYENSRKHTQLSGYGSSWPENHLSTIWRITMSKERKSHREEKKKPAMTPKEKKAARKSRKESRNILGEH